MKALLLCGGVGRRMQPFREDKFNIGFLGRPLLLHVVDRLREAGIDEVVFVANPANRETVSRTMLMCDGVACHMVTQDGRDGMAGAIEAAAEYLTGPIVIVSSNDVVGTEAYKAVVDAASDSALDAAMLAYRVTAHFPGGYLVVDSALRVSCVMEKPERGHEPSDLVNIVVHFHRDGLRLLDAVRTTVSICDDSYERALSELMDDGYRVRAVPYAGFWGPLKRPWDVFPVMQHFLSGVEPSFGRNFVVAPTAVIEGNVVLSDGVRVLENAVIRGPAFIGKQAIIGNNVLIRGGSHIGARSVVGYSTEVKHSYIGDDCWFHSNYIGDSIIDDGCSFGSGCVTANLRFDEGRISATIDGERGDTGHSKLGVIMGRNSRTGINASLFPGVMVGPDALVGPHVCLTDDLGPGMFAKPIANYEVVPRRDESRRMDRADLHDELRKI